MDSVRHLAEGWRTLSHFDKLLQYFPVQLLAGKEDTAKEPLRPKRHHVAANLLGKPALLRIVVS